MYLLVLRGVDRVGLLRDVSATFAARGFNIDFIYTSVAEGRATIVALVRGPGEALGEVAEELRGLGGVEEVQVEQTWEDALHRLADMSKEMPDLFVALSKRLEPRDLASIVQMAPDETPQLLKSLNPRLVASVFEHLDPAVSAEVLEEFDVKTAVYIVENMSIERAVDVLQHAEPSYTHAVLQRLSPSIRQQVKDYIAYDPESVGGIMRVRAPVVNIDDTVEAALNVSRAYDSDIVYVVDHEKRLVGELEIYDILDKTGPVSQHVKKPRLTLSPGLDREKAARLFIKHGVKAAPVVSDDGKLLGFLRADDIIDVVLKEATEDMLKLEAIVPFANYLATKITEIYKKRATALFIIFLVESITATIIKSFEDVIEAVAVAVAFMPLIAHMSGSVGSQATTIITRAISLGEIAPTKSGLARVSIKEFLVGILLGVSMASIGVGFAYVISGSLRVATAVAVALLIVIVWINFVGSMLPLAMARIGVDPAVISGPLITTIGDIVGITTYFLTVAALI